MGRKLLWMLAAILVAVAIALYSHHEPEYEGVWLVPVRVHLLRSPTLTAANCLLSPSDAQSVFSRVNQIWAPGRIQFQIESVIDEEAVNASPEILNGDRISLALVRVLRPSASRGGNVIHVYYIHKMESNGVFQGLDTLFVQDTAQLEPVPGGSETPLPRVTAHELGHALGLPHHPDVTHLMASGTSGFVLGDDEILTARRTVATLPFANRSSPPQ